MRSFAVKPDRDSEALDFRATSELLGRSLFDAQDKSTGGASSLLRRLREIAAGGVAGKTVCYAVKAVLKST
jgi:hypothetical protein